MKNNIVWIAHRAQAKNIGDRILGIGLEKVVIELGFDVKRLEYTGADSKSFSGKIVKGLEYLKLFRLGKVIEVLNYLPLALKERPIALIVGGGQLLLPNNSFLPSLLGWVVISSIIRAKLILFSVGTERVGDFSYIYRLILKLAVKKAASIKLRDIHSRDLIRGITGLLCDLVPDTLYGHDLMEWYNEKKDGVYVCPMSMDKVKRYGKYIEKEQYYFDFIRLIDKHILQQENIYLFTTVISDYPEVVNLCTYLNRKYPNKSIEILKTHEDEDFLLYTLGSARVVVGSRMHSLIIGHILGAEVYAVFVNEKIKAFSRFSLPLPPSCLKRELNLVAHKVFKQELDLI